MADSGMSTPAVRVGSGRAMAGPEFVAKKTVEEIFTIVSGQISSQQVPTATYRCQFESRFRFSDAKRIVPYLNDLGISHLYASPYLKARTGSTHGYDVVDHRQLNPALGSDDDFAEFVTALRSHGMGHILDFVPNHMGIGCDENVWWQDVLENGPSSPYASFFDIDWQPLKPDLANKVLLPVLGEQFGKELEDQRLELHFDDGAFNLTYFDRRFPIAPRSYPHVLKLRINELQNRLGVGGDPSQFLEYQSILTAISHLPAREESDPEKLIERLQEKEMVKRRLRRLCEESQIVREFIAENVAIVNGRSGDPSSFDAMDTLLQDQAYRLASWRVAADEINYRRFFDVNELAAVCMEKPVVFEETHARVLGLLEQGLVDGLRIDHADGLFDPTGYLWHLQKRRYIQLCQKAHVLWSEMFTPECTDPAWEHVTAQAEQHFELCRRNDPNAPELRPLYLIVEKILEGHERLPGDWPVHGTTGYEFVNQVNGLFVAPDGAKPLTAFYGRFIGGRLSFDEIVYNAKRLIMKLSMAGELNVLGHQLDRISERNRLSRDFTLNGLTHALREVVACFPVYRTYTTPAGVSERDRRYVDQAVSRAKRRNAGVSAAVFDFVRDVLLQKGYQEAPAEVQNKWWQFVGRFQQFTGPMMAKAVEDTAFYRYNRLLSLNEVGGDPRRFGITVDEFHGFNLKRQTAYPSALLATATHDTKRGEDTRVRISVLSEIPERWKEHVLRWGRWNKRKKTKVDGEPAPSRNDEYLLYQTLLGTWPMDSPSRTGLETYISRIQRYITKAVREAKVYSSWIAPNEPYEQAVRAFIASILEDEPKTAFREDFERFASEMARIGLWNSLSQTLLKLTAPGVPDIYQGTELWDFSLVDPDNREPVDYQLRRRLIAELRRRSQNATQRAALANELVASAKDGRIKLFVIAETLRLRRGLSDVFTNGSYIPLKVGGARQNHVCTFAREAHGSIVVVIVPRLVAFLVGESGEAPVGAAVWEDTHVLLPTLAENTVWQNVFSGCLRIVPSDESVVMLADVLAHFPLGLLVARTRSDSSQI